MNTMNPIYKSDNADSSKYTGISLLLTTYKIVPIFFSQTLTPYVDKNIGNHQCGFQLKRPTTDQIYCIHQILEKKKEHNGTVYCYLYTQRQHITQSGQKHCTIFPVNLVSR
jgi:hypothetical protein